MRRAVRATGTSDIETIVRNYDGRAFGFASRNFYVSFLAAEEVERNAERYFGPVRLDEPEPVTSIDVPAYLSAGTLEKSLGLPRETLETYNPALLPDVWLGRKYVPRGFTLRVPATVSDPETRIAAIPRSELRPAQTPDLTHTVRRGETVSGIAARYGTSSARIASLNNLSRRNLIRVGQVLKLPGSASARADTGSAARPSGDQTYVVRRGDNLAVIAKRTGVTQRQLMAINSLENPDRIYPGQRLRLARGAEGG
jgi:membrane-bound lytic murein transglycosylase D